MAPHAPLTPAAAKARAAAFSVLSNAILVLLKLAVGLLIHSVSVISEAIHSALDLVAAVIAFFAVRIAGKPADSDHPFGHGKMENLSAAIEALLIFVAAAWIIWEAVKKLLHPEPMEQIGWGVAVMAVSMVANILVSRYLFRVARETDSMALEADAWHLRTDVYTSAGVLGALAFLWAGNLAFPSLKLGWVDPAAAIAVALLILKASVELTWQAVRDLLDSRLPREEEAWIRDYLRKVDPAVRGFHGLRTRKSGSDRFIDFHLIVFRSMSVERSHDICEMITRDLRARFPHSSVTVHVEPCDGACPPRCVEGCFLTPERREKARRSAEARKKGGAGEAGE